MKQYNDTGRFDERGYIDFIRGIAIFLMLLGHTVQQCSNNQIDFYKDTLFRFIYSFHMPLFMLISGYLFFYSSKSRGYKELVTHKTRQLFQPLMMCTIFNYFATTIIVAIVRGEYGRLVDGKWLNNIRSLWFLWCLLTFSILLGAVIKSPLKRRQKIPMLFVAWGATALFPEADLNVFLFPYFVAGYLICKYEIHRRIPRKTGIIMGIVSLAIFLVLFPTFQKETFIYNSGIIGHGYPLLKSLEIDLTRWCVGAFGCTWIIIFLCELFRIVNNCSKVIVNWVCSGIKNLGKYSLEVYALSISFLSAYFPTIYRMIFVKAIG